MISKTEAESTIEYLIVVIMDISDIDSWGDNTIKKVFHCHHFEMDVKIEKIERLKRKMGTLELFNIDKEVV